MSKAILAIGDSTRLVTPHVGGLNGRELFFSYGKEIPDLSSYDVSYWMGGLYALQLQNIGLAQSLCSPGADWLPRLDEGLSGRKIYSGVVSDLQEFSGELFVKPSEAKVRALPAGFYTAERVAAIFAENGFTDDISLQWTTHRMQINYEHRFFVANGEIITGSVYLVNGRVGWGDGIDTTRFDDAKAFANFVLTSAAETMPPAFTLDVGLNEETGKWFVIEANRAWSSGLYGSDPALVLDVVEESCSYAEEKWQWIPDAHLVQIAKTVKPIVISSDSIEESIQFYRLSSKS